MPSDNSWKCSNRAPDAVKAQRVRKGTYRACRCGRETETRTLGGAVMAPPPRPDAWLCMGCEGYVVRNTVPAMGWHPNPRAAGIIGNGLAQPTSRLFSFQQVAKFRHKPYALGRPYSTVK
ncbi:hypothetical protein CLAFUW4_03712 [Fulvia fulva]|uniref:Uncharacterized protein n=1 Tax=Passalora fulva TaxID=5499 RepID=A0A9Q8LC05_PASFU|nr:uncharacterized protein CLAFUR5_03687 [Fulvia fulva]UJO14599.1 hypothetical protein CLAFUR5_03687 [Fulvia fulva]WPV11678.1 hypothetical protein CLAFUW4_03712 [Fulvia fulva]